MVGGMKKAVSKLQISDNNATRRAPKSEPDLSRGGGFLFSFEAVTPR